MNHQRLMKVLMKLLDFDKGMTKALNILDA